MDKVKFGDLKHGDKFYYNCFEWRKDTFLHKKVWLTEKRCNAVNQTDYGRKTYFADHVMVQPIENNSKKS